MAIMLGPDYITDIIEVSVDKANTKNIYWKYKWHLAIINSSL